MKTPHFYAIIIGSEILNGRRNDKHFTFLRDALLVRGHVLFASMTIKDDPLLIRNTFLTVKNDPQGVMFSFGGIGSTPDDLTRQIAADVFSDGILIPHEKLHADILERFADAAFPHRIHMADLPKGSALLHNVINNMSGFALEDRYFFMPGFPEMSHPMAEGVLERFYPHGIPFFRRTLVAQTSENTLIDVMQQLDGAVDFSSLPMLSSGHPSVEISVASSDATLCRESFEKFIDALNEKKIPFEILQNGENG